jgi:hypothetical protein
METLAKQALFWDIDKETLDPKVHQEFVIERILARGDIDDFHWAKQFYGIDALKNTFLHAKTLDSKSAVFWAYYFSEDICTSKPSLLKRAAFWKR